MKKLGYIALLALPLGGCGTVFDPAKLVPSSGQTLTAGFASQEARELTLVAEIQAEDESLRFLSKGQYSCGNPKLLAKLVDRDPAKVVADIKVSKRFAKARKFVDGYLAALNAIATQNKSELDTVDAVSGIVTAVNSFNPSPSAPAVATLIGAFRSLIREGVNDANVGLMKGVAYAMQVDLERAIETLKLLYPAFAAAESSLYRDWNECALEKLVFIRDQPSGQVQGYERLKDVFAKNGGIELDAAYSAYVAKRKLLQAVRIKTEVFDAVVDENAKLASGDLSLQSVNASLQQLLALKKEYDGVVAATKPVLASSQWRTSQQLAFSETSL